MAEDSVDLKFLGHQVQNLQGDLRDLRSDVRDLRTKNLRLEGDVANLRTDIDIRFESVDVRLERLETEVRAGFRANDLQFKQLAETAATNLQIVLAAIKK
ncbi:MAG: hypothetical protein ABL901_00660 [Hyphomicrobiaceae bacterium]